MSAAVEARFWAKVDRAGRVAREELGACWIWTGAKNDDGYGFFWLAGRSRRAHRVAYELRHGVTLADDVVLLHACDNRACVRPEHLTPGSQHENVHDMLDKGRQRGAWFAPAAPVEEPEHAFADLLEAAS